MNKPGIVFSKYLNIILKFIEEENFTWIIKNNSKVINFLKHNKIDSIETYDFQDLFTSIPLDKLHEVLMSYFYDLKNLLNIPITFWEDLTNLCIYNNFIFNGEIIYQQIKGIPQGTSYSSLLANLFLHFFERNSSRNINSVFRYIDDVAVINHKNFHITTDNLYPNELKLIKTSNNKEPAIFLDLVIDYHNHLKIDIFDKRNDFEFNVNKYIFWHSNVSSKIYKNTIINQLIRIKKTCNDKNSTKKQIQVLKNNLENNKIPQSFFKPLIERFQM